MQLTNRDPALCVFCQKRPGIKKYTCGGFDEMVCAACFEQHTARDAFEQGMRHVFELEHHGQFDEALARLNELLEAGRDRDHDGWIARSAAHHRAALLLDAGRYAAAEQAYKEWAQVGFIDLWRRQMYALGLANTLEALGRDREAVPVLESVLGQEDSHDLPLALTVLTELVRLSEKIAQPFDPKWLKVAEGAAECYGVDMPVRDSPAQAVLALEEAVRGKEPKLPTDDC